MLLLGANDRATYSVAKNLFCHNIISDLVSWEDHPLGYSKYIFKFYRYHNVFHDLSLFFDDFITLLRNSSYQCLIPINDAAIEICLHFKDEIQKYTRIIGLNNPSSIEIARNKFALIRISEELGINVPNTILVNNLSDLESAEKTINLPIIVKPVTSKKIIGNRIYNFSVKRFDDFCSLSDYVREIILVVPVMLQSYHDGFGAGFNFLAQNGHIIAYYLHERLHEPKGGGESSYRKTVIEDKYHIIEKSFSLVRAIEWSGVGMIEYKIHNNQAYIMELNGRFWGSVELGILAGIDFPYLLLKYSFHDSRLPPDPITIKNEIYLRNLRNDFLNVLKHKSLYKLLSWVKSLKKLCNKNEFLDHKIFIDFRFVLMLWADPLIRLSKRVLFKINTYSAATPKISSDILKNAKSILMVCEGNICRSPFAERYLKSIRPDLVVSSTGLKPHCNKLSPIHALKSSYKFGINLSDHVSSYIFDVNFQDFDIIFVMDKFIFLKMLKMLPQLRDKIYLLDSNSDIPDPFGKSESFFENTYSHIISRINALFLNTQ